MNGLRVNDCISACGIDRLTVGISSDSLLEPQFTAKLCSDACFQLCPNVVDLYFNLALAEGAYLPDVCDAKWSGPQHAIEFKSSGSVPPPASDIAMALISDAPAPSPEQS
uniref:Uncharacterized protein n=1 Tax=Fagus sylvatica TaxID=28930 RepID=A0A2N9G7R0_FAGSY